jgi:flagellar basal-body rod protein FlgB
MFLKEAVFSKTAIAAVSKSLDACALRAKAIANNIANVTTAGYQRIEVDFEARLREALSGNTPRGAQTHPGHLPLGRPSLEHVQPVAYRSEDPTQPGEINNVDIDMEAAKLAENQLLFMYGVKFVQDQKRSVESAINMSPRP